MHMLIRSLAVLLLLLPLGAGTLRAADQAAVAPGATNALTAAFDAYAALIEADQAGTGDWGASRSQLLSILARAQAYADEGNYREARNILDDSLLHAKEARDALRTVLRELDVARLAEIERLYAEAQSVLDEIPALCKRATQEAEVVVVLERALNCRSGLSRLMHDSAAERARGYVERLGTAEAFLRAWARYLSAQAAGVESEALELLNQMIGNNSYRAFVPPDQLMARRDAISAGIHSTVDARLAGICERALAATNALALRQLQAELSELAQLNRGLPRPQQESLQAMEQSLSYWQGVVTAEESGNVAQALQALNALTAERMSRHAVLPFKAEDIARKRTALLEKLMTADPGASYDPAVALIDRYMSEAESLEARCALAPKVQALCSAGVLSGSAAQELTALAVDLQRLARLSRTIADSESHAAFAMPASGPEPGAAHRWKPVIVRDQNALTLRAIARACDVRDARFASPEQTPQAWTLALADEAMQAGDWARVLKILDICQLAFGAQAAAELAEDRAACRSYLVGLNLERAGELAAAAEAFQSVLRCLGTRVPSEDATRHLHAVRRQLALTDKEKDVQTP